VAETAVNNLKGDILKLIDTDNAQYIFWPNLPALDRTPLAAGYGAVAGFRSSVESALTDAIQTFNTNWSTAIKDIGISNPNVTIYNFDVHTIFDQMLNGNSFIHTTDYASDISIAPTPTNADDYLFWDYIHPLPRHMN